MIRTQIQLTEEQADRLRAVAHDKKTSLASVIREAVDRYLAAEPSRSKKELRRATLAVAGKYRSGAPDVSTRHDDYLVDAYE